MAILINTNATIFNVPENNTVKVTPSVKHFEAKTSKTNSEIKNNLRGNEKTVINLLDSINTQQANEAKLIVIEENVTRIKDLGKQIDDQNISPVKKSAIISEINSNISDINKIAKLNITDDAENYINKVDSVITEIRERKSNVVYLQEKLTKSYVQHSIKAENTQAAKSSTTDLDMLLLYR